MGQSLQERFARLPREAREAWVMSQPPEVLDEIAREEWWWVSRPEQIPPKGDWSLCLALAGRGFGKSRLSNEWLIQQVLNHPVDRNGFPTEWLSVSATLSDSRTIAIEGASGVLRVLDRRKISYKYIKHPKPMILFNDHGSRIYFEGADSPDVGRGYNAAGAVLDEIAKWKHPYETWFEGILPALRADLKGDHPRVLVTTTPKPIKLLREWMMAVQEGRPGTVIIRGSTFDNAANLSEYSLETLRQKYAGTLLGRQELFGELLDGRDGSMFTFADIDNQRLSSIEDVTLEHLTIGVDPTLTEEGDEMGIVVMGRDIHNHMYVLADASTGGAGKHAARHIWQTYHRWGADTVVIEDNLAKKWMVEVLQDMYIEMRDQDKLFPANSTPSMLKTVDSRVGKKLRAEPVGLRYEQHTVHHIGEFSQLEKEMLDFDPSDSKASPNRMDALVHAARHLMSGERKRMRIAKPNIIPAAISQTPFMQTYGR